MAAVQPSDLYPTWLASVPRAQPVSSPSSPTEVWNGQIDGYQRWWSQTARVLYSNGLACMAASTRVAYGLLDPAHVDDPQHADHAPFALAKVFGQPIVIPGGWLQPTRDRAQALNAERAEYIRLFQGRWCTAIIDRIEYTTAQLILDPAKPELLTDPDQLYDAIQKRAVGGSPAEVGPRTFREVNAIEWPTKRTDGKAYTVVEQVDEVITLYRSMAARFVAINDTNYTMTEAAMVAAVCMRAPRVFDTSAIATFEACIDLSDLQNEMQKAARRIDERAPTGLNAFVAIDDAQGQDSRIDRLEAGILDIKTAIHTLTKKAGGGGGGPRISGQRRYDEAAGPTRPGEQYCSKHGWGRHQSGRCYVLHPELAPADWGSGGAGKGPQ